MDEAEKEAKRAARLKRLESAVTPRGCGMPSALERVLEVRRNHFVAPEWIFWPATSQVFQWQAVALSIGLSPECIQSSNGFIKPESFSTEELQIEFGKRLDLVRRLTEKNNAPLEYFASLLKSLPMPSEMAAMVSAASDTQSMAASNDGESAQFQPSAVDDSSQPIACHSACTKQEIIDGFNLVEKKWDDILSRPDRDGSRFRDALVQPGRRGRGGNGKTSSALWNPVVFARLLIQHKDMNQGQVVARFKKAWPKLEDEMMVEIGEIER